MIIELEFLDMGKVRVHEKEMIYKNVIPPIPGVGDRILVEGMAYNVKERDFIYLSGNIGVDIKVSLWCEQIL